MTPYDGQPADAGNSLRTLPEDQFDEFLAKRAAGQARDVAAEQLWHERDRIWQDSLVAPVTSFLSCWIKALADFGDTLRAGDFDAAASEFVRIDGLVRQLHQVYATWLAERNRWFEQRAKPWNNSHPERPIVSLGSWQEPTWLVSWCALCSELDGPSSLPSEVAKWIDRHQPSQWWEYENYAKIGSAILLFARLGNRTFSQTDAATWLRKLPAPTHTADLVLIWGALVLPSTAILEVFYRTSHDEHVMRDAAWLVEASDDRVRKLLRGDFRSRHSASLVPCPEPPESPHLPSAEATPAPSTDKTPDVVPLCPVRVVERGGWRVAEVRTATGWEATEVAGEKLNLLALIAENFEASPNGMTVQAIEDTKRVGLSDIPKAFRESRPGCSATSSPRRRTASTSR